LTERARTVFLGTGAFAVPVLEALAEHRAAHLVAVVTAPERRTTGARSKEPPVVRWADGQGITTLRPNRLRAPDSLAGIRALAPELLVLADYGQIVPGELLEMPRHGALNLHPSLLPRWRGATPIPAAILEGDAETGVTLMRMDAGLDTGPIVAQWRLPVEPDETAPVLEQRLASKAAELLSATLEPWLDGKIRPVPQDESAASITRPLRREDGRLDPARTAAQLERQVRAYQPWPGSFIDTAAGRLVVWKAHSGSERAGHEMGALVRSPAGGLALAAEDRLLELEGVQPAGGRRMTASELLRGRPTFAGAAVVARADRDA
jgi:methionyl-tRNA formyltransferase